jgi:hypothetical protein
LGDAAGDRSDRELRGETIGTVGAEHLVGGSIKGPKRRFGHLRVASAGDQCDANAGATQNER